MSKGGVYFALSLVWLLATQSLYASEEEKIFAVHIPAAKASIALKALARQTGRSLLFQSADIDSVTTNAVYGSYRLSEALKLLLYGTGLSSGLTEKGVIAISTFPLEQQNSPESIMERNKYPVKLGLISSIFTAFFGSGVSAAVDQDSNARPRGIEEIIVTAQKRSQSANEVGLSITAVTGDTLQNRGIKTAEDLVKVVPGLTVTPTAFGQNVYTLRGVGFFDKALAGAPTVSVYIDEIPFTSTQTTQAATLDIERVEVIKGPQGTLFGQNSTGGAIQYIAAKPTDYFTSGVNLEYGRFDDLSTGGFVSGPLGETLRARAAIQSTQGGAWQKSSTRNEELGDQDRIQGRLLLDWTPTDNLKIMFNFSAYHDGSEPLGSQVVAVHPQVPALTPPGLAFYETAPLPSNARNADWFPEYPQSDNNFHQGSVRIDYNFGNEMVLTSISDYQHYEQDISYDLDGTSHHLGDFNSLGDLKSINQEIRLSGVTDALEWIIGANYTHADVVDNQVSDVSEGTAVQPIPTLPPFDVFGLISDTEVDTYAIFGNAEYEITDQLSLVGGLRYTESDRSFSGCSTALGENTAGQFEALQTVFKGSFVPIDVGGCVTMDANFNPVLTESELDEDNLSIRAAINYKTLNDTLLYASFNRGYKAGGVPVVNAITADQYNLIKQERLDAYEVGFKASLFERQVNFNAAAFYYDYSNKQLTGRVFNPIFGTLEALVAVPKSRVIGVEAELQAQPIDGLMLSIAATYVDTKIQKFVGFDLATTSTPTDLSGSHYSNTPAFTAVADIQYNFSIGNGIEAFIGASSQSASEAYSSFTESAQTKMRPYTLIDLRAGIEAEDGRWRLSIWGKNVTDKYYWTGVFRGTDQTTRQPSRPVTYGLSFEAKFGG